MSSQPDALQLADALAKDYFDDVRVLMAADELRRLHELHELYQDKVRRLHAENEALRSDAERYRWLRESARATSEHWGGRWSLVIEGPAPGGNAPPASIDAAIDAARSKE